jgi:hypothetical protein
MGLCALRNSAFIFLVILHVDGYGQKTDKIHLKNGDVITGEIKNMKLAKLKFDMTGLGVIYIKWEEIISLRSDKTFEVRLKSGAYQITRLDSVYFSDSLINLDDIVEIVTIRNTFIKRLEGDINLGLNYTKSNSIFQFNFSSSTTYRIPRAEINFVLNHVISNSSSDTAQSRKQDATIGALRKLDNQFFVMTYMGWEENTQLGLENRFLVAGGGGKIIISDNHQRLLTGAGLTLNKEKTGENVSYEGNLEALAMIQFKKFRYSSPKLSIDAQYTIYPSLTDPGRIRMNLQVNTSVETFKDFFVGFTFYDNYDNRSSSSGLSNNDYGLTFTIGYTFGK